MLRGNQACLRCYKDVTRLLRVPWNLVLTVGDYSPGQIIHSLRFVKLNQVNDVVFGQQNNLGYIIQSFILKKRSVGVVLGLEAVGWYKSLKSVTHRQCDAGPTVTFPAVGPRQLLTHVCPCH